MLKFCFGASGAGKSTTVYQEIIDRSFAEKDKDFLIIVPDQFTMQTQKDVVSTYMADAISGLLTIILKGESGEAYNIADEASNITLKDLAKIIADYAGKKVVFEIPDAVEASGYSKATKALLDGSKLKKLGWKPRYGIKEGIERTLDILNTINKTLYGKL